MEANQQLVDQIAILKVEGLEYGMLSLVLILNKSVWAFLSYWLDHHRLGIYC